MRPLTAKLTAAALVATFAAAGPAVAHNVVVWPADLDQVRQPLPASAVARVGVEAIPVDRYERWYAIGAAGTNLDPRNAMHRVGLRRQIMEFLLLETWVRREAAAHGVTISDAEAARAFVRAKRESFETERDYQDFLAESQMTDADARWQIRYNEQHARLRRHATWRARTDAGKQRLYERFERRLRRKWRQRTACDAAHRSRSCGHIVVTSPPPAP